MPADLDLSPEAVERMAARLDRAAGSEVLPTVYLGDRTADWCAAQAASTIRTLAAENTRLRAERDEQRDRAEEAESEITRAQEQVSAEFEGDCWMAMRNLLDTTGFDWSEYSEDGVSASEAQRWIVEELDRLEAERDAAWQAGAEAMRERAAYEVAEAFEHHCAEQGWKYGEQQAAKIARAIRALPLPDQPKEAAPPVQASTLDPLLSVATDDEADTILQAARRANIEVPE